MLVNISTFRLSPWALTKRQAPVQACRQGKMPETERAAGRAKKLQGRPPPAPPPGRPFSPVIAAFHPA